jgi:hypothetical protein
MNIFEFKEEGVIFSLESMTKGSISEVANKIIKNIVEGHTDALQEFIKAKGISELSEVIISGIKELAIDEASKYSDGESVLGCKFQVRSLADSYDFSHDDEWSVINNEIDSLKKKQKDRESKMIDAMKYAEVIDDQTGEVIPPAIVKKRGGKTIAISIPK